MFNDPFPSDLLLDYNNRSKSVKDVPQDLILKWRLPLNLHNEALEELYKINYHFLQASYIDRYHRSAFFFKFRMRIISYK